MSRADDNLARMRDDAESDWPSRLLTGKFSRVPIVSEEEIDRYAQLAAYGPDLTEAELRALKAYSRGLTIDEAAAVLGVGRQTILSQLKSARFRLRAKNSTHAVCEAIRKGLIP